MRQKLKLVLTKHLCAEKFDEHFPSDNVGVVSNKLRGQKLWFSRNVCSFAGICGSSRMSNSTGMCNSLGMYGFAGMWGSQGMCSSTRMCGSPGMCGSQECVIL